MTISGLKFGIKKIALVTQIFLDLCPFEYLTISFTQKLLKYRVSTKSLDNLKKLLILQLTLKMSEMFK